MATTDIKWDPMTGLQTFTEVPRYRQRGNAMLGVAVVVTLACTLAASHLWMMKVEPVFGRITRGCEEVMTGRSEVGWSLPKFMANGQVNGTANGHLQGAGVPAVKEGHVS